MKLAIITVERKNHTYQEYKFYETEEELEAINQKYQDIETKLYSCVGFVGYYSFDIITYDSFDNLTLADLSCVKLCDLVKILNVISNKGEHIL